MAKNKKKTTNLTQYGSIVFGVGLAIAIIASFFTEMIVQTANQIIIVTLMILGLLVGILNITSDETISYLAASLALILIVGPFLGLFSQNFFQSQIIGAMYMNIIALVAPGATFVALKTLFITAKDEN